jgi:transcriptional regulator with XRE-family HTH domain
MDRFALICHNDRMIKAVDRSYPGTALKEIRSQQGLTLRALAARIGMPYSTLSKLENGKMAMTYDKLVRLAQGLGVDLGRLVNPDQEPEDPGPLGVGRRSVSRAGEWIDARSERHTHHYPATDLLGKLIEVNARTIEELGGLVRHAGEEYLYVLSGHMALHSDLYAPLELGPGDSAYFDSGMAHGYIKVSDAPCTVLSVCAGLGIQRLSQLAGRTT